MFESLTNKRFLKAIRKGKTYRITRISQKIQVAYFKETIIPEIEELWYVTQREVLLALFKSKNKEIQQLTIELIKKEHDLEIIKNISKYDYEWALKYLINSLYQKDASDVIELLGDFGDKRAIAPIKKLLNKGQTDYKTINNAVVAIKKIGDPNTSETSDKLTEILNADNNSSINYVGNQLVIQTLCEIGDKKSAVVIINRLFNSKKTYRLFENLKIESADYKNLFEDYTEIILSLIGFNKKIETVKLFCNTKDGSKYKKYLFDDFLEKLCSIKSEIANNILHKVVHQQDKLIGIAYMHYKSPYEFGESYTNETPYTIDLSRQRKIAKEELEKRGNPKYNPDAYFMESWKILG